MKAAAISCVIALISPVSDTVPRYDIERCAGDERGVKSYVELITCVQMFEAAK